MAMAEAEAGRSAALLGREHAGACALVVTAVVEAKRNKIKYLSP